MKFYLAHIILLYVIGIGSSLDCKICVEAKQNREGSVEWKDVPNNYYKFFQDDDVFCLDDSSPDHVGTCDDVEADVCVAFKSEASFTRTSGVLSNNYVKMTEYRCGKDSEITEGSGDSRHCQDVETRIKANSVPDTTDWKFDTCVEEITKRAETGGSSGGESGGSSGGESGGSSGSESGNGGGDETGGRDCRYEMCSGGEIAHLKFILVAASLMLHVIL